VECGIVTPEALSASKSTASFFARLDMEAPWMGRRVVRHSHPVGGLPTVRWRADGGPGGLQLVAVKGFGGRHHSGLEALVSAPEPHLRSAR